MSVARIVTQLACCAVIVGVALAALPDNASANHSRARSGRGFATFLNASQVFPPDPPGAWRPVTVCNENLLDPWDDSLREAVTAWNSSAGFYAFMLKGPGEFWDDCEGNGQINVRMSNSSACTGSWIACHEVTAVDAGLFEAAAIITARESESYTQPGMRGVLAHELGHVLALGHQHLHTACNTNVISIMEASSRNASGQIDSQCGSTGPRSFDNASVEAFFSQNFGSPPRPQVIWAFPISDSAHRVVFKVPDAGSHTYQRALCPGIYPTGQPVTLLNTDVMLADAPLPSGISICNVYRHAPTGNWSIGVHVGESTQGGRRVTGIWTTIFDAYFSGIGTQQNVMRNESSASILATWVSTTANQQLAQCPAVGLDGERFRECRNMAFLWMVPRFWWAPVDPLTAYFLEVP